MAKPPPMSSGLFPTVRRADSSGRSTPLSVSGGSNPPPTTVPSGKDSFANLVSFGSSNSNKNLSLLEQQKRLQEERARKEAENRSRYESQYGGKNSQFWDTLEKGGPGRSVSVQNVQPNEDEEDILAAFNASAPVDASTHFPVPSPSPSPQTTSNGNASAPQDPMAFPDDDDPFGLNQLKPKQAPTPQPAPADDDDFLGLLGKPVSEIPRPEPPTRSPVPSEPERHAPSPRSSNGTDRAVAELVDMGFPADKASQALKMTPSGSDVQAAVGLLLTQAHEESRQRSRNRPTAEDQYPSPPGRSRDRNGTPEGDVPSWMQRPSRGRSNNRSPASAEKDPSQVAAAFGNNLLKTANSLWKTGSKKVQQVVQDLNADQDPNQPRWLREAALREQAARSRSETSRNAPEQSSFTNEALLLEPGADPRPQRPARPHDALPRPSSHNSLRSQPSPAGDPRMQQPAFMRQQAPSQRDPRSRLTKGAAEEQSAQAYALASTHRHREKAAEAYKRGDYSTAHEGFTSALNMLPDTHPITIIIRSNRAMTALKIGEPKVAISDADTLLELIGPSKGDGESIDLGNGEPSKPMKDFFGKGLMRKAEALEQLERWADAAQAWKLAVENGHGGSTSIQGRNRCEKAAGISKPPPKPSAPARRPPAPAPKKTSALSDLQGGSGSAGASSEAVTRLRAANQAAERADEEKFALTDSVDARLAAWKSGKQDNLRALLGSLDTVLWPEAGWKKVNMSELIMPNKVKVQYMKGISKVHPDKIPTTATTEQRMIAGAVFGALNEAWDKFKKENNL
ncbi:hypothetical protein ATERTT37_004891 [Aspergillus terreus]